MAPKHAYTNTYTYAAPTDTEGQIAPLQTMEGGDL